MKVTPGDRIKITESILRAEQMLNEASDARSKLLMAATIAEVLIAFLVKNYGRRHAYEWLQRQADQIIEKEWPDEPR